MIFDKYSKYWILPENSSLQSPIIVTLLDMYSFSSDGVMSAHNGYLLLTRLSKKLVVFYTNPKIQFERKRKEMLIFFC